MTTVLKLLAAVVGASVVGATLLSAVRTVVLPRATPVLITRAVFGGTRMLFDLRAKRARTFETRDRIMSMYAPITLLLLPLVWIAATLAGFTLLFWAAGQRPLSDAFITSGSSLLTLGYERPDGLVAIALSFVEAGLGIAVLALLLVTYLPSMYAAFSRREQAVAMLEARAGSPPSGVEMLIRMARIDGLDELDPVWEEWERWFADLGESHTSLPALAFFRSPEPTQSWITSAGAMLDTAALYVATVDLPSIAPPGHEKEIRAPQAEVCIRSGYLALRRIAAFFRIPFDADPRPDGAISIRREEFDDACERMRAAGVPLRADLDRGWRDFAGWRVNYDAALVGLAQLTMAPYAPWSSDRSLLIRS
jgi:hypothetical protein